MKRASRLNQLARMLSCDAFVARKAKASAGIDPAPFGIGANHLTHTNHTAGKLPSSEVWRASPSY